jgi:hypothetical protein
MSRCEIQVKMNNGMRRIRKYALRYKKLQICLEVIVKPTLRELMAEVEDRATFNPEPESRL